MPNLSIVSSLVNGQRFVSFSSCVGHKPVKVARKDDDIHQKYIFLKKTQHLKSLNTCKKHFEMILLNLPPDECKVQGKCIEWYKLFYVATAIATIVYSLKVTINVDQCR